MTKPGKSQANLNKLVFKTGKVTSIGNLHELALFLHQVNVLQCSPLFSYAFLYSLSRRIDRNGVEGRYLILRPTRRAGKVQGDRN